MKTSYTQEDTAQKLVMLSEHFPQNVHYDKEWYIISEISSMIVKKAGLTLGKGMVRKDYLKRLNQGIRDYLNLYDRNRALDIVKTGGDEWIIRPEASEGKKPLEDIKFSCNLIKAVLENPNFKNWLQHLSNIEFPNIDNQRKQLADELNKDEKKQYLDYCEEQERLPPDGDEYDRSDIKALRETHSDQAEENGKEMEVESRLLKYKWDIVFDVVFNHLITLDVPKLKEHLKLTLDTEKRPYEKEADEWDAVLSLDDPEHYYKLKPELLDPMKASSKLLTSVDMSSKQKKKGK